MSAPRTLDVGGLRVTLESELGRGAMGTVFRGRLEDGRAVAVKLLSRPTEARERRFEREARVLAALDDPNVVRFVAASEGPPAAIVMELVEGETLESVFERGRAGMDGTARLVAGVASGIAAAHRQGVVHRDLKPANVLVRASDGRALVSDFGIARDLHASLLTSVGHAVGTYRYMSPEQALGNAGLPADVWAIGVVLYEGLTGVHPFASALTVSELIVALQQGPARRPRELDPEVPPELEAICLACLALAPDARPSASDVAASLRAWRSPGAVALVAPRPREPWRRVALALALVGAAAVLATALGGRSTPVAAAPPPWGPPGFEPAAPTGLASSWEALPRTLWSADQSLASPLRGVRERDPAALADAWLGAATLEGGGRVRLRPDLRRAAHVLVRQPRDVFGIGSRRTAQLEHLADGVVCEASNDVGVCALAVGAARWSEAHVVFRVRTEAIDQTTLDLRLGGAALTLLGRTGIACIPSAAVVPFAWSPRPEEVRFAPGAAPGKRVQLDGACVAALDAAASAPAGPGPLVLRLLEGVFTVSALEVEGVPQRPDVRASATLRRDLGASARVSVAFRRERPGELADSGGPFVSLGAPGGDALDLELDGGQLVLRHGETVLAAAATGVPAPARGWLSLERHGDRVRARAAAEGEVRELLVLDPLPLAAEPLRASYGSTAPALRFERATVETAPGDEARRALDAAAARTGTPGVLSALEALSSREAAASWRRGAFLLATVTDVGRADRTLLPLATPGEGDEARRAWKVQLLARRARAADARDSLVAAADGFRAQDPRRADALARAVLASVVAADRPGSERIARRLVAETGGPSARRAVDSLERLDGEPVLLSRLAQGGESEYLDPALTEAASGAVAELDPERRGAALVRLAGSRIAPARLEELGHGVPAALFTETLATLDQAEASGAERFALEDLRAQALMALGRLDEALSANERAILEKPRQWFPWHRRARILEALHRPEAALEAQVAMLACAPAHPGVRALVAQACERANDLSHSECPHGLVAAAILARWNDDPDRAAADGWRKRAVDVALTVDRTTATQRDGDLTLYVLAASGVQGVALVPDSAADRPTAVLARARIEPSATNLEALRAAAKQDRLVEDLVRLDPVLARIFNR